MILVRRERTEKNECKEDKKTDKIKLSELSYAGEIEYLVDDDYEDDSDADYFYQIGTSK